MGFNGNFVSFCFVLVSVGTSAFKIYRTAKSPKGHGPENWKQIIRYLVLYYSLNIGVMITEPFMYQHYLNVGAAPQEITVIYLVPFFVEILFNFIPLKYVKIVGPTPVLAAGGVLCALATLLRTKKNFDALCVSQFLVAIARTAFHLSCSDWKFGEGSHDKTTDQFFRNVCSTADTVMTTVTCMLSMYLDSFLEEKQLFAIGTYACLSVIPLSLIVFNKKIYPTRKDIVKPTYSGIFIIFFFTVYEVFSIPRILSYIMERNSSIQQPPLFACTVFMNIVGDSIVQIIDMKYDPNNIIIYVTALLTLLHIIIIYIYNQKWIIFLLFLLCALIARIGRVTLDKLGNSPIELSVLYGIMCYGTYKFGFETTTELNLKICVGASALCCITSLIKKKMEPSRNEEEIESIVI